MAFLQTETLWVNELAEGVAAIVLDVPGRKDNVVTGQVLSDLETALDRISAAAKFHVLIVRSAKPASFCAGIDLAELSSRKTGDEITRLHQRGQQLCVRIAELPVPTVAVIAGACLGAGLELALACDYRVVVNRPATQLALNQIEIGLIPGWGGTQRLPALVGLERALQMILGGRRLDAAQAAAWRLADALSEDTDEPPPFLAQPAKVRRSGLPRLNWRQRLIEANRLGRWLIFRGTERLLRRRLPDDMPAPWEALNAVRLGLREGFAAGAAAEVEAIRRLAAGPAHRNLLGLSIQREEARRVFAPPQERDHEHLGRIGIISGGPLAIPLAQLAVLKDCHIVVRERNELALGVSMLQLMGLFQKAVEMGLMSPAEMKQKLAAVHGTTAWKGFDRVDLVLDASEADLDSGRALFRQMEQHVAKSTILASTSSWLGVGGLQEGLREPARLAGVHFFQPLARSALVEVVRSDKTEEKVARKLAEWVAWLGKLPLLVHDRPGLVVYRVLLPYLSEAVQLVSEGIGPDRVDEAMRRFGMADGPLEHLDQMGVDKAEQLARTIEPILGEAFPPQPVFALMTERGWLGRKTALGFYRYHRRRPSVHQAAVDLCLQAREAPVFTEPATPREQADAIRRRLIGLLINEAARCLSEGRIGSAPAVDLALVLGGGWPAHRGGPLAFAEQSGHATWLQTLTDLGRQHGPRYHPSAELQRLARPG